MTDDPIAAALVADDDLAGPADPGHLLTDEEWASVQAEAEPHARRAALAAALQILNLPARFHGGAQTPTVQIIHDAETPIADSYAASIGRFFQDGPAAGTSAHRMIGPNTIVRMLALNIIGYHVGPAANRGTVAYEQCGYASYSRAQWTTPEGLEQLETLAGEIARDAETWGIPDRHLTDSQLAHWSANGRRLADGGRATHDQVHRVLGGTTHTDPTPNYPLDLLNAAVTRHRGGTPTPTEEDWFDMATKDDLTAVIDARLDAKFPATGGLTERVAQRTRQVIASGALPYGLDSLRALLQAQGSVLAEVAKQQDLDVAQLVAELDDIEAKLAAQPAEPTPGA